MVTAGADRLGEFEAIDVMNSLPNDVGAEKNKVSDSLQSM
jgi:hypothetical protein